MPPPPYTSLHLIHTVFSFSFAVIVPLSAFPAIYFLHTSICSALCCHDFGCSRGVAGAASCKYGAILSCCTVYGHVMLPRSVKLCTQQQCIVPLLISAPSPAGNCFLMNSVKTQINWPLSKTLNAAADCICHEPWLQLDAEPVCGAQGRQSPRDPRLMPVVFRRIDAMQHKYVAASLALAKI